MRRSDPPNFAPYAGTLPGDERWDDLTEVRERPDPVTARIYQANCGLHCERSATAEAGIAFFGTHGEGDEYGAGAFASLDGAMMADYWLPRK